MWLARGRSGQQSNRASTRTPGWWTSSWRAISVGLCLAIATVMVATPFLIAPARAQLQTTGASGLPLPRFVSLKSDKVNVRIGPGQDYDVSWIFVRAGWPVEIVQEFENWRKIRDTDGSEGWVFHSLLSGRRTALVTPWIKAGEAPIRADAEIESAVAAYLEPRVVAEVAECQGDWCRVEGKGYSGWIKQEQLWGVYPGEAFEGN